MTTRLQLRKRGEYGPLLCPRHPAYAIWRMDVKPRRDGIGHSSNFQVVHPRWVLVNVLSAKQKRDYTTVTFE
jgi:hypothetical protein